MMIRHINEYVENGNGVPQSRPGRRRKATPRTECGRRSDRAEPTGTYKGSVIYFVSDGSGNVKVGQTNDISKRVCGIQTGNAKNVTIEAIITAKCKTEVNSMERYLHRTLKASRERGEWFRLTARDISAAVSSCIATFGDRPHFVAK